MFRRLIDKIKSILRTMTALNRPPEEMARAMALGVMISVSPFVGLKTYAAVFISGFLKLPVYPLVLGAHVVNVVTMPFVYTLTTKFGIWLIKADVEILFDWEHLSLAWFLDAGRQLFLPFFVGSNAAALLILIPVYIIALIVFKIYARAKQAHCNRKRQP